MISPGAALSGIDPAYVLAGVAKKGPLLQWITRRSSYKMQMPGAGIYRTAQPQERIDSAKTGDENEATIERSCADPDR